MSKISIIIRCYNEEEHIGRLLSGVLQQTEKDSEIIVVDSGSTDATLAIASRYPVKIISIKKDDFSFGYSLNVGCEASIGKFLVIVSAHVYPVHHDWLEKLLQPFENDRIGLVYGKQRGNDTTKYSEQKVFAKWFPDQSNCNQGNPFCNNANTAVRKDLWERFRYDESLTGLEDLAFAKQLLGAGYKVAYQAESEVIHVHNETWKSLFNRYRREAIALKEILPQERFGLFDFYHMYTKNVFGDCFLAMKEGVFWRNARSILVFRLMQFWGTYRGYTQHGTISRQLKEKFYYPSEVKILKRKKNEIVTERPVIDYRELEEARVEEDN
ncbi:MAG: glycosyltransferase family 2 protein [Desulfuromonadales bacterium]|nr:glycosyltransferase family 2 protein [Desulfuromonadales bacterium]